MSIDTSKEKFDGWPALLRSVAAGNDITSLEAQAVLAFVLAGQATDAQLAALLMGLQMKGVAASELIGFGAALRNAAAPLHLSAGVVDVVGTGGSAHRHRHALNVSTMASFVVSAAGVRVCKHGNTKASSTSGSFDFLSALGVAIDVAPDVVEQCVADIGIGFAFARTFHPAMRHVGPVRAEMGVPTVFNLLGPLVHPGAIDFRVLGTGSVLHAEILAAASQKLDTKRTWVVVGEGGYDELTLAGETTVFDVTRDRITRSVVTPDDAGLVPVSSLAEVSGGDGETNAAIFVDMAAGEETGPRRDIVVLNAAAALVVAGKAESLAAGATLAVKAIETGAVKEKLDELRAKTGWGDRRK